jgi:hypothetical protein
MSENESDNVIRTKEQTHNYNIKVIHTIHTPFENQDISALFHLFSPEQ